MGEYELEKDVWLWFDPAQYCNIKCELCYTRISHARSFLTQDDLDLYIDRIKSDKLNVKEVTFNWRGEPLTNRHFPRLLRRLISAFPQTKVQFHTNAMLLSERVCRDLCEIETPYYIFLSIDGGNKAAHERNRGANTFDLAVRGGLNLIEMRGLRNWPNITLYQLDLGVKPFDYDRDFLSLASKCDLWQRSIPILKDGSEGQVWDSEKLESCSLAEIWGRDSKDRQPVGACFWAGYSLSIAPNGDVSVCILSQVQQPDGILGNLKIHSPKELLRRAAEFRRRLIREGRREVPHCASCHKIEGIPRPPRTPIDLRPLAFRKFDASAEELN